MDAATQCLLAGAVEVGDTLHPNARNLAIAYLFLEVHGAPEPTEWKGHGNVQTQIRKSLNMSPRKSIIPVLELIWACYLCGRVYAQRVSLSDDAAADDCRGAATAIVTAAT
jgi:hypothetical protein